MSEVTTNKYLDFVGLSRYDEKINKVISDGDDAALAAAKAYADGLVGDYAAELGTAYTTVAKAVAGEKARAEGVEQALTDRLDAIELGDNSIDTKIKNAVEALDSEKSQAAGADGLALNITQVDGKITSISGSIAAETYDAFGAATAEQTRAKGVEGELTDLTTDAKGNLVAAINEVDAHANTAQSEVDALEVFVGVLPESATSTTVVGYVEEVATAHDYDDTALTARVKANEDAIGILNGDAKTPGSVDKKVSDAIAGVVANAPEAFDTMKEIADWIGTGEVESTTAAAILSDVSTLKTQVGTKADTDTNSKSIYGRIEDLEAAVGEGGSVAAQIDEAVKALDSEKSQVAGADGLALSITQVDGKIAAISGSITPDTYDAFGAAANVLGTASDVAGTATVHGALAAAAKAQADVDAFARITDEEIDSLFATV